MDTDPNRDKLEQILEKVNRIDRQLNPPAWKVILKWFLSNLLTIIILIFIAVIVFKVWNVVTDVLEYVREFDETIRTVLNDVLDKVKFW